MTRHQTILPLLWCLASVPLSGQAQQGAPATGKAAARGRVLAIGNLTGPEIDALSRERTLFLLTVGMLEWHGPHLPIASDLIGVKYEAERVAERLSRALPGWNVVVMPDINYGTSGINDVGKIAVHPGTYGIRQSTLRSLVADIGGQIAQNRFKWVFVMNGHGAPAHHIAVNDACDFVSEVFNATMLNVSALFKADSAIQSQGTRLAARHFSEADLSSFGMDPHAGVGETSGLLAIRPDLVRSNYRKLPSYRVEHPGEMREVASRPGWQGYFSSPARGNASYGRAIEMWWVEGMTNVILRAVRGESLRTRPRFPGDLRNDPIRRQIVDEALQSEREFEVKLERWLAQRPRK